MNTKIKIKLFEKRDSYIRYEVWNGKTKLNSGWYKVIHACNKGAIAKEIEEMYFKHLEVTV